jgi:hypothetical protein
MCQLRDGFRAVAYEKMRGSAVRSPSCLGVPVIWEDYRFVACWSVVVNSRSTS